MLVQVGITWRMVCWLGSPIIVTSNIGSGAIRLLGTRERPERAKDVGGWREKVGAESREWVDGVQAVGGRAQKGWEHGECDLLRGLGACGSGSREQNTVYNESIRERVGNREQIL